jgi:nudix-type nucleoside diphosphatase (YffH/AdpP family)
MTPRILQQTVIHSGWGRYLLLKVGLADGVALHRQLDDHGDAAGVLPYDPQRRTAVLVRLWRVGPLFKGAPPYLLEAPAGMVDPGETAEACVRREALEETGLNLKGLDLVTRAWASPSVSTEILHLYLAAYGAADRVAPGGGVAEEHEGIEVVEIPLADLWRQIESGEIADMKTVLLAHALRVRRPDLF